MTQKNDIEYVGFWQRVLASILDAVLLFFVIVSVLYVIHGSYYFRCDVSNRGFVEVLNSFVLPSILILLFWCLCSATPGKMMFSAKIVDAKTGEKPTIRQFVIRYLGYYVSLLFLGLGFFWIALPPRKQGWHDKLAGTVVVRRRRAVDPTP